MKKLFTNEWFYVLVLSLLLLLLSILPFLWQLSLIPIGHVFLAQHNSLLDFPMFLSVIRQGQEGHLTQIQRLTSEPQFGTWVHFFYLPLGWITGPFKINPVWVYHSARILVGFLLLITFYFFIKLFFTNKKYALLVFFITTFTSGFPHLLWENGHLKLPDWPYMYFFSGFDVLKRYTFLPHGMMRDVLFLGVLIFWLKLWEMHKIKYFVYAVIGGFFLGLFSPVHALVIYLSLHSSYLYLLLKRVKSKTLINYFKMVWFYTLVTIASSLYLYVVFEITPWKVVKVWEGIDQHVIPITEFILGNGPLFFLSLFSLNYLGKSLKYYFLVFIPILTTIFLFTPLAKYIGLSNFRFLGIPLLIFWGVLGGIGLINLSIFLTKKYFPQLSPLLFAAFLSLLFFVLTSPNILVSYRIQRQEIPNRNSYNVYPLKAYFDGFIWLQNNTKPQDIVLADSTTGNLIPGYSGNVTYVGHAVSTINYTAKKREVADFYAASWPVDVARKFLISRNVKYVVWSYEEISHGGDISKYRSFLTPRFKSSEMIIFSVENAN